MPFAESRSDDEESQKLLEDSEASPSNCARPGSKCRCRPNACAKLLVLILLVLVYAALVVFLWYRPKWLFANVGDASCDGLGSDPHEVVVVTYNLYWWCVSNQYGTCPENADGKGLEALYANIRSHPFDLIGFQQCEKVEEVIQHSSYPGCLESYDGGNDAAMAWNNQKYGWIADGHAKIAHDKYGPRYLNWVRLALRATGGTLFFANLHGPVDQCSGDEGIGVANATINTIEANKGSHDLVILTGDFNCDVDTSMLKELSLHLSHDAASTANAGADHILSSGLKTLFVGEASGTPSNHPLVKATYQLPEKDELASRAEDA